MFARQYHRLGAGNPSITFSQSLLLYEDCFRPALRWYDNSYPEVTRVDVNVDRALVDGGTTSINYRGDYISPKAAANAARAGLVVSNDLSLFEPFHGVWGPYAAILPNHNASTMWSTCMPNADSFTGAGPPPMPRPPEGLISSDSIVGSAGGGSKSQAHCWNPSYDHIREWYKLYPTWAGKAHPFTYTK